MSSCPAKPAKEKKFGVAVCRERKCPDLQKDPKYPESPQHCAVTHGMPGAMHCCIKEMDDEHFIRQISGQLNSSPYGAPRPGIKNCPEICPYKLVSKVDNGRGKLIKEGHCALNGALLGTCGVCPCNVLGNPRQDDQIQRLQALVKMRLGLDDHKNPAIGLCAMGVCPDGKDRDEWLDGNTSICPIIRLPHSALYGGRGCPLWRIPAKMLPAAPDTITHVFKDKSGKVTETTTRPAKKPVQKEQPDVTGAKIIGSRQLTFMDFVISRKSKKPEVQDPRCKPCQSSPDCPTHDPEKKNCVAKSLRKKTSRPPGAGTGGGPQPYVEHCCGTCGHHKGRKTFHETCPRLSELLFKGGTKSAKVLMEETQRENCDAWISKADKIPNITWCSTIRNCLSLDWEGGICTKTGKKVKDQTHCPTQHLIVGQERKSASKKPKKEREKP